MALPIPFPEADDMEDFPPPHPSRPLPVKRFPRSTVSCWSLSPAEREEVARTGVVWLTTRTFKSLEERADGVRYQPDVSIHTNKQIALLGWGEEVAAPAADRIVTFQDNQPAADDARAALEALSTQLRSGNDFGDLTPVEVEEAAREVMLLEHAFACEAIRVDWIMPIATRTLRWIASEAGRAMVGQLAVAALAAIAVALGLHI
ncbi:MAG: hypothetical protein ACTHM0_16130 [Sphingomonas sp.]